MVVGAAAASERPYVTPAEWHGRPDDILGYIQEASRPAGGLEEWGSPSAPRPCCAAPIAWPGVRRQAMPAPRRYTVIGPGCGCGARSGSEGRLRRLPTDCREHNGKSGSGKKWDLRVRFGNVPNTRELLGEGGLT